MLLLSMYEIDVNVCHRIADKTVPKEENLTFFANNFFVCGCLNRF